MSQYLVNSLSIGSPVISGTPGSVLFIDSSGNLGEDNNRFRFDGSNVIIGDNSVASLLVGHNTPVSGTRFHVSRTVSGVLARIENTSTSGLAHGLQILHGGVNSLSEVFTVLSNAGSNTIAKFLANSRVELYTRVGANKASPSATVDIGASGFASAGNGPLKFNTGVYLTTPEAGLFEWDNATAENPTFTPVATRYRIPLVDSSVGGLTSGMVPYATTNGRLADTANLTWNNTNKTLRAETVSTSQSALVLKKPEHTSTLASAFSLLDSTNQEVIGFTPWSGGGGTGGYGALVLGGTTTAAGHRYGEISPRENAGATRVAGIIFQRGSALNTGEILFYGGNAGPFNQGLIVQQNGRVGVGVIAAPTARLHIAAGSTAASSAPLKFTSGSLNTSPEAGAVEFLTDKSYLVITTGTARKEFALADIALTSTRVPFMTTNGRLTDITGFTFVNPTLSLPAATGSTPSLIMTPGSSTGTTEGSYWSDSTQKCLATYSNGVKQFISTILYISTANGTQLINNAAETSIIPTTGIGTRTLPANFFFAGKTIRVTMAGTISIATITGNQISILLKKGTTTLATASLTWSTGTTTLTWRAVVEIVGRSGTTVICESYMEVTDGTLSGMANQGVTTTISTSSEAIDITGDWSTAGVSDQITQTQCLLEVIG